MSGGPERRRVMSRRTFLRAAGLVSAGALTGLAGGIALLDRGQGRLGRARLIAAAKKEMYVGFTDGYVSMPAAAEPVPPFFPDPAAPKPFTTWVMGIRDLSGLSEAGMAAQRGKGQISGPFLFCYQNDDVRIHLRNLGLSQRPDLIDSHTIHWHGFPNQIVYFDGVPDNSLSVPIGRELVYRYIPEDPGTYMYHCHVEDVEHVHMGLTGVVFVLAEMSRNPQGIKYAYNDPDTRYDREFAMLLTELDNHVHFNDRHGQDNDWSDFKAAFRLLNGRAWPDTIQPNIDPMAPAGSLGGLERLRYNPNSSLVQANEGERILLRLSNLGFEEHSMVLPGIPMTLVGRDAKPLLSGRPDYGVDPPGTGTRGDISSVTYRVDIGPGESRDLIFTAPRLAPGSRLDRYPFYDRNSGYVKGTDPVYGEGVGAMRTEVRVYPAGTLPPQNDLVTGSPRPNGVFVADPAAAGGWRPAWATGTEPL